MHSWTQWQVLNEQIARLDRKITEHAGLSHLYQPLTQAPILLQLLERMGGHPAPGDSTTMPLASLAH
ncbi:hypothetical protein WK54_13390 [Burkholderia ubonensis]|nr:hypothetical protein WK54_13390 [Burkholderia ubonensis]